MAEQLNQAPSELIKEPPLNQELPTEGLPPELTSAMKMREEEGMRFAEETQAKLQERAQKEMNIRSDYMAKRREAVEKYEGEALPPDAFVPSKETATDLTALFSTVALTAFLSGTGNYSGVAALNNMAGAMEGYRKGRKDLFDREMRQFEKNLKAQLENNRLLSEKLTRTLDMFSKNRDDALAQLNMIDAELQGGKIKYDVRNKNLDGIIKFINDNAASERAINKALATLKAKNEMAETKLSPSERKEKRGIENLDYAVEELRRTFKPEYANMKFDTIGQAKAMFDERIRSNPEMAEWWRRYENVALPERHAMFGATLTAGERESWRRASIGPGNSTAAIEGWLNDKKNILGRKFKQFEDLNTIRNNPSSEVDPLDIMSPR